MLELFNALDWFIVIVAAYFVIRGLGRGFISELGKLVALFAAIGGAIFFYQPVAGFLRRVVGKPDFWWETLSFIICFLALHLFVMGIAGRISKVLYKSSLSLVNRLLGGAAGLFKGAVLCYVLVNLLLMAQPYISGFKSEYLRENWVATSCLAPGLLKFGNSMVSIISSEFGVQIKEKALDAVPDFNYSLPLKLDK